MVFYLWLLKRGKKLRLEFFFLISKKIYIQKEPHENIRQTREYREGHKQREKKKKKTRKQTEQTKN